MKNTIMGSLGKSYMKRFGGSTSLVLTTDVYEKFVNY